MIRLDVAIKEFNKGRDNPIEIEKSTNNTYSFHMEREKKKMKIGEIMLIRNLSNCGVVDCHNLWGDTLDDVALILSFMKVYALYGGRNILTYNTSSDQRTLRRSLKEAGFSSPRTTYKNSNSGNRIKFHVLAVT